MPLKSAADQIVENYDRSSRCRIKNPAAEWPALDNEAQARAIRTLIEAAETDEQDVAKHLDRHCLS